MFVIWLLSHDKITAYYRRGAHWASVRAVKRRDAFGKTPKDLARRTIFVGARCARPRLQKSYFAFEKGTPSPPTAELPPRKEPLKDDLLRVAVLIDFMATALL